MRYEEGFAYIWTNFLLLYPLIYGFLDLFVIAIGRVRGKYPIISSIVELSSALSNIVGSVHNHVSPIVFCFTCTSAQYLGMQIYIPQTKLDLDFDKCFASFRT